MGTLNNEELEILESLKADVGLPEYLNYIFICDGAGTILGRPAGWHIFVISGDSLQELSGGVTSGTNNYAELAPILHALWSLESSGFMFGPRSTIAIISDSEVTVRCGRKQYSRSANSSLWAMFEYFEQKGVCFEWRHVPRNSNYWNKCADLEAKKMKLKVGNE